MYKHSSRSAGESERVRVCVSGDLVAGEAVGSRTLTGKLVALCRYSTHCLMQGLNETVFKESASHKEKVEAGDTAQRGRIIIGV